MKSNYLALFSAMFLVFPYTHAAVEDGAPGCLGLGNHNITVPLPSLDQPGVPIDAEYMMSDSKPTFIMESDGVGGAPSSADDFWGDAVSDYGGGACTYDVFNSGGTLYGKSGGGGRHEEGRGDCVQLRPGTWIKYPVDVSTTTTGGTVSVGGSVGKEPLVGHGGYSFPTGSTTMTTRYWMEMYVLGEILELCPCSGKTT